MITIETQQSESTGLLFSVKALLYCNGYQPNNTYWLTCSSISGVSLNGFRNLLQMVFPADLLGDDPLLRVRYRHKGSWTEIECQDDLMLAIGRWEYFPNGQTLQLYCAYGADPFPEEQANPEALNQQVQVGRELTAHDENANRFENQHGGQHHHQGMPFAGQQRFPQLSPSGIGPVQTEQPIRPVHTEQQQAHIQGMTSIAQQQFSQYTPYLASVQSIDMQPAHLQGMTIQQFPPMPNAQLLAPVGQHPMGQQAQSQGIVQFHPSMYNTPFSMAPYASVLQQQGQGGAGAGPSTMGGMRDSNPRNNPEVLIKVMLCGAMCDQFTISVREQPAKFTHLRPLIVSNIRGRRYAHDYTVVRMVRDINGHLFEEEMGPKSGNFFIYQGDTFEVRLQTGRK